MRAQAAAGGEHAVAQAGADLSLVKDVLQWVIEKNGVESRGPEGDRGADARHEIRQPVKVNSVDSELALTCGAAIIKYLAAQNE